MMKWIKWYNQTFPTYSTEQNPHGCCDGYMWDSAVDNCIGIFTYIHSYSFFWWWFHSYSFIWWFNILNTWQLIVEHFVKFSTNWSLFIVECRPGFSGPGCFITCPHPLYGKDCQDICKCSQTEYCDFMSGCLESKY